MCAQNIGEELEDVGKMKRLKKSLCVFLMIALFVSVFVGCSSEEKQEVEEKVVIRLYVPFGSQEPAYQPTVDIVEKFMEDNPNTKVELEIQAGTQYHDKLKTEIATDTLANVFVSWGGSEMVEAVKAEKLVDMTEFLNENPSFREGFMNGALSASNVTYQDIPGQWGIPLSNVAGGFYYNKELFEQAGVEPPETWEEMFVVIEKLKAIDTIPWVIGGKDGWRVEHLYDDIFYKWNGTEAIYALADRSMKYVDEGAVKPWQVIIDINEIGGFGPNPASVDFGMEQTLFKTGKAAMNFSLSAFAETFGGEESEISQVVGFFPTPYFEEKPAFAGSIFSGGDCALNVASKQSQKELEASYKLVLALAGQEGQSTYANSNALLMTRRDLDVDTSKINPLLNEFSELLENANEYEISVCTPDPVSTMLHKTRSVATAVINGQLTAQQAGEELDSEIKKNIE